MRRSTKVLAAAAVPVVAVAGTAAVTAAPVVAASGDYDGTGIAIRANSTLSSEIYGRGYAGDGLTAHCFKTGDYVTRGTQSNNVWINNTNWATNVRGASHSLYLFFGPVGAC